MSAFLCTPETLSVVVNAIDFSQHYDDHSLAKWLPHHGMLRDADSPREAMFGALLQTNLESLSARYPEFTNTIDEWCSAGEQHYTFRPAYKAATPIIAIKQIQCFEYQSCEHAGWGNSPVFDFCRAMTSELIAVLPGWDAAPWGV